MGSLIVYSGIATKMEAAERWRIKGEQFLEMTALGTIADAVQYLYASLSYREIFGQMEDKDLHKGSVEQHLNLSQCRDFTKLYQLANIKQRCFLDPYFMRYEITILKTCLRNAAGHRGQRRDLSMFRDSFGRHSALDLITLSQSQSMEESVGNLKGSVYYGPLYQMLQNGRTTLPACETALDVPYFRLIWKIEDKHLSRNEQRIIAKCSGARMDMLNFQWICRLKRFYQLEPGEIYVMLTPMQFHPIRKEINRMVEAEDLDILYGLIRASWYGGTGLVYLDENQDLDHLTHDIIDRIYQKASRKDPYSIAILNSYLYFEEREVERIIITIEKIRYGLGAS